VVNVFESLEHATGVPWVLWSASFVAAVVLAAALTVRARLAAPDGGLVPDAGVSVRNVIEMLGEMLVGLAEQNMGPRWRTYFPFVASIFLYILIANLIGLVPGMGGATRNPNVTWAWATLSFVVHQYVGIREHGFGYLLHFMGPSLFDVKIGGRTFHVRLLAPIYAVIELISHVSRVFTLAVRLLANMSADAIVVGVWIALVPAVVPALFMGLGVLVAFLQAYVFAMLSMIYIGLALEEAH